MAGGKDQWNTTRMLQRVGEAKLDKHSRKNLQTGKQVNHPDGSVSTVLSGSYTTKRGKQILIPQVYDGRIVGSAEAVKRAKGKGYPVYDTPKQATAASKKISEGRNATKKKVAKIKGMQTK